MRGIDFMGNTSLADAKLLSSEGGTDVFSDGFSDSFADGFSATVAFSTGILVEADGIDTFKSTCPKDPSKISSKEEVSVPARAILILPKPSQQSCAGFLFK